MKNLIATVVLTLAAVPCFANDQLEAWGAGSSTCSRYLDDYDSNFKAAMLNDVSWALGFLTAENKRRVSSKAHLLHYAEPEKITAYLVKYCKENQFSTLYQGVVALSNDLAK